MIEILRQATEKAGGVSKLARLIGIRHNAFYVWKRIPAERVLDIERVTGISRHRLRPDIYPIFHSKKIQTKNFQPEVFHLKNRENKL